MTILELKDHEALVVEMGMNHLGEISLLTSIAKPTICIITNIGTSHIGNLGSRENILKAKLEILEGTHNPTIIINNDNDLLHKWYIENKNKYNIITYGIAQKSDINAKNIKCENEKSQFGCTINKEKMEVVVPVGGEHFILNSLCAIAVGSCMKIENEKLKHGIEGFELTKKRMDISEVKGNIKIINDSYNASFESMKASLKYLSEFKYRKIAVLGDMLELGSFSEELHKKVGEEVAKNGIDKLFCSGKNSKNIVKGAIESGMREEDIYYFEDKYELLSKLKRFICNKDVILFKASNGMKFFELAEELINSY